MTFEWEPDKDKTNQEKHGVSFYAAQDAFFDGNRIITLDVKDSTPKD